ncbi:PREDICTED: DNA polymerase eta isoform X2 [Tarenaya hassleriana]|nr:PREDICTED: DNA polymerase eta isoform X2 [Tarenaya hassleriana]
MRGDEARAACPEIHLVQVPVARGKADLNSYRNAGSEVVSILSQKGKCERASIDEVYLDLTEAAESMLADKPPETLEVIEDEALRSHVLGMSIKDGDDATECVRDWICRRNADRRDKLLACGILIVADLRKQVLKDTEFTCSAGIAHNKMLAKLASGMNKPAQQTVVPYSSVQELLHSLPIKKMKQLGGKLGTSLQIDLGVNTVGDLLQFSEGKLQELYGMNTGTWLWNIARGISGEEVQGRLLPKSHGSGKTFPGPRALKTLSSVQQWLNRLCEELSERLSSDLEQNKRLASTLTLHASAYRLSDSDSHKKFPSKSCPLRYGTAKIQEDAFNLFQAALREFMGPYGTKTQGKNQGSWRITGLSVSASKITDIPTGVSSIMKYFHNQSASSCSKLSTDSCIQECPASSFSASESCSEQRSIESETAVSAKNIGVRCKGSDVGELEEQADTLTKEDVSCPSNKAIDVLPQSRNKLSTSGTQMGRMERKRNNSKEMTWGTPSIADIFKNYYTTTPPSMQEIQEDSTRANSSGPTASQRYRDEERTETTWSYKMDEIDESVIDELPPEIQREIRTWLRPSKRAVTVTGNKSNVGSTSSIASYFSPLRDR